jgi:hypothetical protein
MASYTTLIQAFSTLPSTIHLTYRFVVAALATITPAVLISLAYRFFVFYASTRIIPAVRENGARSLEQEPSLEEADGVGQILAALSWYSPSILIAVYSSLLMQHFALHPDSVGATAVASSQWTLQPHLIGGAGVWKWINIGATMVLYAVELYIGDDVEGGVTGQWTGD